MIEWKKNTIFDIKITKIDDESGKLYKTLNINFDGNLNIVNDDGNKEILLLNFLLSQKYNILS